MMPPENQRRTALKTPLHFQLLLNVHLVPFFFRDPIYEDSRVRFKPLISIGRKQGLFGYTPESRAVKITPDFKSSSQV
jgi:hypothetical protein